MSDDKKPVKRKVLDDDYNLVAKVGTVDPISDIDLGRAYLLTIKQAPLDQEILQQFTVLSAFAEKLAEKLNNVDLRKVGLVPYLISTAKDSARREAMQALQDSNRYFAWQSLVFAVEERLTRTHKEAMSFVLRDGITAWLTKDLVGTSTYTKEMAGTLALGLLLCEPDLPLVFKELQ